MDKYSSLKKIGSGAYGVVYSAQKDGDLFAIKKSTRGFTANYIRETAILSIFDSAKRGIVYCEDIILEENSIILEFIKYNLFDSLTSIPKSDRYLVVLDLLIGLHQLHLKGILHRDLKEDNILYDGKSAYITDFGQGRFLGGGQFSLTPRIFTTEFSPPEVLYDSVSYDYKSDVWSMGIIVLEIFLGKLMNLPKLKYEAEIFIDELTGKYNSRKGVIYKLYEKGMLTEMEYNVVSGMLKYDPMERLNAYEAALEMNYTIRIKGINFNGNYNDSILKFLFTLDVKNIPAYVGLARYNRFSKLFSPKFKLDTIHLAIRYFDLTEENIEVCLELAKRLNEVIYNPNTQLDEKVKKCIIALNYSIYQPTLLNVMKLKKKVSITDIKNLTILASEGNVFNYSIERVINSLIEKNDLYDVCMNIISDVIKEKE